MPRRCIACAALVFCALLAPAANAQAPQTPLTPAQFAAIDAVFTTQIGLSKDKPLTEHFTAARAACRGLDRADPLLAAVRNACTASVDLAKPIHQFAACGTAVGCVRSARRARIAMTNFIPTFRALNAAVAAASLVDACAAALRSSQADLRYLERTRGLLRLVQDALMTGSRALGRRLQREAAALDRLADKQPTATRERRTFRAGCAPPAP